MQLLLALCGGWNHYGGRSSQFPWWGTREAVEQRRPAVKWSAEWSAEYRLEIQRCCILRALQTTSEALRTAKGLRQDALQACVRDFSAVLQEHCSPPSTAVLTQQVCPPPIRTRGIIVHWRPTVKTASLHSIRLKELVFFYCRVICSCDIIPAV